MVAVGLVPRLPGLIPALGLPGLSTVLGLQGLSLELFIKIKSITSTC